MKGAVLVYDVLFGRLEHVRGELLAFVDDLAYGLADRHAADREAAAAVGPVTERGALSRVAVAKLDTLIGHAQLVGHDLGKRRLVSLAV